MKMNLPITNNEFMLRDEQMIVSKTDLKGVITYVNRDFIEASGYSEQELIGSAHNILRHPEMPALAFKDLWDTLKQGRPWTGIVKNRRKNGDFYWVEANITPIYEGSAVVGYLSVRFKPNRERIDEATRLYRDINAGKLPKQPWTERLNPLRRMDIPGRVLLAMCVPAALIPAAAWMGPSLPEVAGLTGAALAWAGLMRWRLCKSLDGAADTAILALRAMAQGDYRTHLDVTVRDEMGRIIESIKCAQTRLGFELAETRRIGEINLQVKNALDNVSTGVLIANADRAILYANPAALSLFQSLEAELKKIAPSFESTHLVGASLDLFQRIEGFPTSTEGASSKGFDLRLGEHRLRMVSGPVLDERGQRVGSVAEWTDITEEQLRREREQQIAEENIRARVALDNVSTGIMIADNDRNIVYVNKAVQRLLKQAEADIRRVMPGFDADRLVGTNLDHYHKEPSHQARLLATIQQTYSADLEIGGQRMRVITNPVLGAGGERMGSVAEWSDRFAEASTQAEVAQIVEAAAKGDFTGRLDLKNKQGFFLDLSEGLNHLLDTVSAAMGDFARVLGSMAEGNLVDTIEHDYQGTLGAIKSDFNTTVARMTDIISRIKEAADTINTAASEIAVGNTDLAQRTEEQAASLEETVASMEELAATVRQNASNARQANQMAIAASEVALKGGTMARQVADNMRDINDSAHKIVEIIGVIDGIAFQTNILALNAAVEAARAGEQGRGFAVVAGEVRNLAQRSAAAAKEIKTLIGGSVHKVEAGVALVNQAGGIMEDIVVAVKKVTDIMAEISAASMEQSTGIEQVNLAMNQIDEVTQQNAALVEEASAAAESLRDQAMGLSHSVGVFRLQREESRLVPSPARPATTPHRSTKPTARAKPRPGHADNDDWAEF